MFDQQAAQKKLSESTDFFKHELGKIRTGRATPALVEHITIEAYNSRSPLMQLASISAPDPKTIVIQPWDRSIIQDVERALRASDLNLSPVVDGALIRLNLPPLTEENRQNLVKLVHERAEACRVTMRQQREKMRSDITRDHSEGAISEDQKFKYMKQLDDLIHAEGERVSELANAKETDIMKV